jgi:hypothetical protein
VAEDPHAIEREIAQTREELAATVDAISYKANVPARAREGLSDGVIVLREKGRELVERSRPVAERVRREAAARAQDAARLAKEKRAEAVPVAKRVMPALQEKRAEAVSLAKRAVPALQAARTWILARLPAWIPGRASADQEAAPSER